MGFDPRWVNLIMSLIRTVKFVVTINGKPGKAFTHSLGIRQGLKIGRNGPTISHLFFEDNALLFLKANLVNCQNVKQLLNGYCHASGQLINFDKPCIFFSLNTPMFMQADLSNCLSMTLVVHPGKYLGKVRA
ncbi:hypothetical protein L3X38_012186 [Prunus dulcis]|uniref:Uncharacterized protein n=1 Tax=Prunus dulcis TaxID=3755 RepID=A0AAD4WJ45_PRUDU|nr:hypothetical protein L3X38_012186 [Prunus dulcis]